MRLVEEKLEKVRGGIDVHLFDLACPVAAALIWVEARVPQPREQAGGVVSGGELPHVRVRLPLDLPRG